MVASKFGGNSTPSGVVNKSGSLPTGGALGLGDGVKHLKDLPPAGVACAIDLDEAGASSSSWRGVVGTKLDQVGLLQLLECPMDLCVAEPEIMLQVDGTTRQPL